MIIPLKKCSGKCKETKPLTEYNKNKGKKDGHNSICRECSKARSRQYYSEYTDKHKKHTAIRRDRITKENRQWLYQYLLNHPCVDCSETDPIVLEFDHVKGDKRNILSRMKSNAISTIQAEIGKCEIRCANCHRKKTAKQFNWYNDLT